MEEWYRFTWSANEASKSILCHIEFVFENKIVDSPCQHTATARIGAFCVRSLWAWKCFSYSATNGRSFSPVLKTILRAGVPQALKTILWPRVLQLRQSWTYARRSSMFSKYVTPPLFYTYSTSSIQCGIYGDNENAVTRLSLPRLRISTYPGIFQTKSQVTRGADDPLVFTNTHKF